jgi:DNA-binding response OmpR family regulator
MGNWPYDIRTRQLSGQRILVAEDDPASLELVQVYLESRGYEVAAATDGNRALDMGASGEFDLLILDVHMPLYGGLEVLQMLRKRLASHQIKIIALTGDTRWALRDEMKRLGVDSYMIKPVSLAQLGADVARLLGQPPQKQQRENDGSVTGSESA